jgi:predicted TIM-barrel enzyme
VVADVFVKHAVPLGWTDIVQAARDTAYRAGADILVVTGAATGQPADHHQFDAVRASVPDRPCWVGSGVTAETVRSWVGRADGAIVGTALHHHGDCSLPLDPDRVRRLVDALSGG